MIFINFFKEPFSRLGWEENKMLHSHLNTLACKLWCLENTFSSMKHFRVLILVVLKTGFIDLIENRACPLFISVPICLCRTAVFNFNTIWSLFWSYVIKSICSTPITLSSLKRYIFPNLVFDFDFLPVLWTWFVCKICFCGMDFNKKNLYSRWW